MWGGKQASCPTYSYRLFAYLPMFPSTVIFTVVHAEFVFPGENRQVRRNIQRVIERKKNSLKHGSEMVRLGKNKLLK